MLYPLTAFEVCVTIDDRFELGKDRTSLSADPSVCLGRFQTFGAMSSSSQAPPPKVATLTEGNLIQLQLQDSSTWGKLEVPIAELEYPCNDKSSGVTDFKDWKYFKDFKAESVRVGLGKVMRIS